MRLIDADALLQRAVPHGWSTPLWVSDIVIKNAPTIDAEPVVRCKNCEYYNGEDKYCVNDIFAKSNGYCMYGKEKDE